jgi:phosphoadenosine phosphosulfate reductase
MTASGIRNPGVRAEALRARVAEVVHILGDVEAGFRPASFATSFGAEDMVLLDLISRHARSISVFTLDTGRLPEETYRLMSEARDRYPVAISVYCPDAAELERYINLNGPDAFYRSVAQRKECCHVRKVAPLRRALAGKKAWITGLRREQSPTREGLQVRSRDDANGLEKFNPLLDWSWDEVQAYIADHDVPYNALHDKGYPSIGCAPCTRAVVAGEDIRSGRWWWEDAGNRECGLHVPRKETIEDGK